MVDSSEFYFFRFVFPCIHRRGKISTKRDKRHKSWKINTWTVRWSLIANTPSRAIFIWWRKVSYVRRVWRWASIDESSDSVTVIIRSLIINFCFPAEFTVVTWSKYYCTYKKQSREFSMLQYNQMSGRSVSFLVRRFAKAFELIVFTFSIDPHFVSQQQTTPEIFTLSSCIRRLSEFEKRYCFDLIFTERSSMTYTFQALSEEDIKAWLDAMDGKEPVSTTVIYTSPVFFLGLKEWDGIKSGTNVITHQLSTMILMRSTFADQPYAINEIQRR